MSVVGGAVVDGAGEVVVVVGGGLEAALTVVGVAVVAGVGGAVVDGVALGGGPPPSVVGSAWTGSTSRASGRAEGLGGPGGPGGAWVPMAGSRSTTTAAPTAAIRIRDLPGRASPPPARSAALAPPLACKAECDDRCWRVRTYGTTREAAQRFNTTRRHSPTAGLSLRDRPFGRGQGSAATGEVTWFGTLDRRRWLPQEEGGLSRGPGRLLYRRHREALGAGHGRPHHRDQGGPVGPAPVRDRSQER